MTNFNILLGNQATLTASDNSITHKWTIDDVESSDTTQTIYFSPLFTSVIGKVYTIKHEGINSCGELCTPITHTMTIVSELPKEAGTSPFLMVGLAAGALYMMLSGKKK